MAGKISIVVMLLLIAIKVDSQHLIGLTKNEVLQKMQETSFVVDNSARNTTFNYIKYVDRIEEKTFLVFLSDKDVCTSTKLMSDFSSLKATVSEFNKKYKKKSATEWEYKLDGITYKVTLKKDEWFYSVVVTTKTK